MENGLVSPSVEGTPLSNLVPDELDQELERRGRRFVRYADDSNIYVRSERAGQECPDEFQQPLVVDPFWRSDPSVVVIHLIERFLQIKINAPAVAFGNILPCL